MAELRDQSSENELPADIKARLEERLRMGQQRAHRRLQAIEPAADGPTALSFGQQRLWVLNQLFPKSHAYHWHQVVRITGPLDLPVLGRALDVVVDRHEVLRSRIDTDRGRPRQIVGAEAGVRSSPLRPLVDVGGDITPEHRVIELAGSFIREPFDLASDMPMRMQIVRATSELHWLLLCFHHIAFDERSISVFWNEAVTAYEALLQGATLELPHLPVQFRDFAHWQRTQDETIDLQASLQYWQHELTDLPVLALPTDFRRPAAQSFGGATETLALSASGEDVERFCRQREVTPFSLFLTVFAVLLQRYSGQNDIPIGAPFSNRTRPEIEDLIGFFLNTMVLRVDLSGDPTFAEAATEVQERVLGALAHMEAPFERVVEMLHPERRLNQNPVFQVMFAYQEEADLPALGPNTKLEPVNIATDVSKFDLTLFVRKTGKGYSAAVEYRTDLFERAVIDQMLESFDKLLSSALVEPATPIAKLPAATDVTPEDIVEDRPPERTMTEILEDVAEAKPDEPAVLFEDSALTYRELMQRADAVARRLQTRGVDRNDRVGLLVERSLEMVIGIVGILKAGAAYVPIDPNYPQERIRFLVEDADLSAVLSTHASVERLPDPAPVVAVIDDISIEENGVGTGSIDHSPDDLAYLIYTSGSTGRPKGVRVLHRNLVYSTWARTERYAEPPGRFLLLSPFSFDSSIVGLFWTLFAGGTLVLPTPGQERDVVALSRLIEQEGVTHTLCLPSLYASLLDFSTPQALSSLTNVILAGETFPTGLARRHHTLLPEVGLYNEYGPTEATVWCSVHKTSTADRSPTVPIGRPIPNTRIHLLDAYLNPVPLGAPGEICIEGPGVSPGYHNRPEETAARFIQHGPGGSDSGTVVMYRSGDLGRRRSDGSFEFLGRVDRQMKIRGYRIEPEEIADVLRSHHAVTDVVVTTQTPAPSAPSSDSVDSIDLDRLARSLGVLDPEEADRLLDEIENMEKVQLR